MTEIVKFENWTPRTVVAKIVDDRSVSIKTEKDERVFRALKWSVVSNQLPRIVDMINYISEFYDKDHIIAKNLISAYDHLMNCFRMDDAASHWDFNPHVYHSGCFFLFTANVRKILAQVVQDNIHPEFNNDPFNNRHLMEASLIFQISTLYIAEYKSEKGVKGSDFSYDFFTMILNTTPEVSPVFEEVSAYITHQANKTYNKNHKLFEYLELSAKDAELPIQKIMPLQFIKFRFDMNPSTFIKVIVLKQLGYFIAQPIAKQKNNDLGIIDVADWKESPSQQILSEKMNPPESE